MEHRSKDDIERINQLEKEMRDLVESRARTSFTFTPDQIARVGALMRVSGMDSQQQQKFFPALLVILLE